MRRFWFFIFPFFLDSCPMASRHAMAGPVGRCDGTLSLLAGHREITGGGDRCGRSGRDSIPRAAAELQAQQFGADRGAWMLTAVSLLCYIVEIGAGGAR